MAFTPEIKNPGDLVKSQDWNDAMQAIVALFTKFDQAAGHLHSGAAEDAPPITQAGVADNAISTNKLQDAAVTLGKLAPGVIRDIGIVVAPFLSNGQSIPIPAGFTQAECVFFAFMKLITIPAGGVGGSFQCLADTQGVVTLSAPDGGSIAAVGVAIAKRGGWT
ncbi:MAG: hypothetical protein WCD18_01860 [Thermosynechococcaceae cyanobacterium]